MKNYYKIIGVQQNASTEEIKKATKQRINQLKSSQFNSSDIVKGLAKLEEAYKFLTDYHSRRKLDQYLDNSSNNMLDPIKLPDIRFNNSSLFSEFNNNLFNPNVVLPDINKSKGNSFYYSSSFSSSKFDNNGKKIREEKKITNNNGKIDGKHTITTTDKDGTDIIKDIPIDFKKIKDKKNKLDYFIN